MPKWNPEQYLKFANERTQPSVDLAARIGVENPKSIIDIGCGPGNSTRVLKRRWHAADICGLDSSEEMIAKAKLDKDVMDDDHIEWILGDASTFRFERKYDVVFSNAAIQWIPNHDALVARLFDLVCDGGALGIQIPADDKSPIRQALREVAANSRWSGFMPGVKNLMTYHNAEFYYNLLSTLTNKLDLWETIYYHVVNSRAEIVQWYKGTGMKPYLERLPDEHERELFTKDVLAACAMAYPVQSDGKVLYPFKRVFFVAYKTEQYADTSISK